MRLQSFFTDPIINRSFKGNSDSITSCLFNPNMKQAITGSEDGNVFVWNFKPQMRPFKFIGHKGSINEVAINPLGTVIASASNDETVRLWNNSVYFPHITFYRKGSFSVIKGHTAPVRTVDFSADSRSLLTGSNDKIMKIFSLSDKKFHSSYVGHSNWVRCARFSPDVRLIGSCSDDNTVKLWDVEKKSVIYSFIDHLDNVNSCRFSPDGTCIASGSKDKKVKIWDIRSGRLIQHYDAHSAAVTCVSYHPSGNYLITSSSDSTIKIWDLKLGQILYTVHGHQGPINTVAFSSCGDYFASGGVDSILMVWKSNIRNMDEEFKTLSKVQNSKMLSNKKQIEENKQENAGGDPKQMTKGRVPAGQRCEVIIEKGAMMKQQQRQQCSINVNQSNQSLNDSQSSNIFSKMPGELSSTFEKLIQQLDIVAKTMKIMDQRIKTVETQIGELSNSQGDDKLQEQYYSKSSKERMGNQENVFSQNLGATMEGHQPQDIHLKNIPVEIFEDISNHAEEFNQQQRDEEGENEEEGGDEEEGAEYYEEGEEEHVENEGQQ